MTMNIFNEIYMKCLLWLHSYLYYKISNLSSKLNNNIHPKHRILNYHKYFVDNIDKDSRVLDIGCGNGFLTYEIAEKAKEVIAVDINKISIAQALKKFNRSNIRYLNVDATKHKFKEKFDFIVLSNVLEHIKDRYNFLKKIKPLTKYILIRVPMLNRSWITLYKRELGVEYRLDRTHYIEYTFETFKKEIESVDLKIINYSIQFGEIWAKAKV